MPRFHSARSCWSNSDGAIEDFDHTIAPGTAACASYRQRGMILMARDNLDRATTISILQSLLIPRLPQPMKSRGDAWRKTGNLDRAIAAYSGPLNSNPAPAYFANRGEVWQEQARPAPGFTDFPTRLRSISMRDAFANRGRSASQCGPARTRHCGLERGATVRTIIR